MIILIGLIIGLVIGLFLDIDVPAEYSTYVAIIIIAALDAIVGGLRASLNKTFQTRLFVTGLLGSALIGVIMVALGKRLNVALDLAVVVFFGGRILGNFGRIRRLMLEQADERNQLRQQIVAGRNISDEEVQEDSPAAERQEAE